VLLDTASFVRRVLRAGRRSAVMRNNVAVAIHPAAHGFETGAQLTDEVVFEFGDDTHWGFLELTIEAHTISGSYTAVTKDGQVTPHVDTFTIGGPAPPAS
jgi:hypothetical protein